MFDFRRILLPIDFSDASRHAREHAVAMAKWYESEIDALYVMPPRLIATPPVFFYGPLAPAPSIDAAREAAHAQLVRWTEEIAHTGVKTAVLFDEGDAATCILRHAETRPADLVVMGTHGLSGFDRLVLGSVTEKVLRKAACPVMTVPPAALTAGKVPYRHVLCAVDFSEPSLAAFRLAVSLAEEADANLTILHALDFSGSEGMLVEEYEPIDVRRRVEETARGRLEALVTDDMRTWCRPAIRLTEGKPYRQILEVAAAEHSDVVVLGVHGRNPLDLTLFGSTTNHVIRRATCPVLTLKH